jgi:DNA polymerase-3 subunit alpha
VIRLRVLDLPLFEADKIAKLIPGMMMPSKWNTLPE